MATSEVARLLENIRLSYESAYLALHGTAIVAKHEYISCVMSFIMQTVLSDGGTDGWEANS